MLDCGWPMDGRGDDGETALHVAAWHGYADLVRVLLDRGARTDIRDALYQQTPLEWAVHGSVHGRDAPEEYRQAIAELQRNGAS